jgi:lipoprotein-anchoring transpeptidase ErfK/SrfK
MAGRDFRNAARPDWVSTAEMIRRQQYLPRGVAEGAGNPLAMYLGDTQFRIHGTNDPTTIGKKVSSGCVRLTNEEVIDLYGRATLGAARSEDRRMPPPSAFGLY